MSITGTKPYHGARLIHVLAVLAFTLGPLLAPGGSPLQHGTAEAAETNPRSDYWRQVRKGVEGYSAVQGQESNELIEGRGQVWRQIRNGPLATYGSWLLGFTLLALSLLYLIRGPLKMAQPRGMTVPRWSLFERVLHWYTAVLFLLLAFTGLCLLYGRALLIPLMGHEAFASFATLCKAMHNYSGPWFIAGLLLMLAIWFKDNLPRMVDLKWFLEFGGMIGNKHPSAHRMNGGEKAWFWTLFVAGIALSVTGLVLDFPNFGQERAFLQVSHVIHLIAALVLISFALGHIYIATLGTEGALQGMINGRVDANWAKQHHDLWYRELMKKGIKAERAKPGKGSTAGPRLRGTTSP